MKILKAHINNFGKLSDLDIDFNINPFVILKDNGEGKTTLLNFILALIYGLETVNARSKEEPLREIYYPYNGGLFGGSLEIEKNGKTYRIERSFDRKTETKDDIKAFINNKETEYDFAKTVIGLDEVSFLKTLYYRNNDFDLSTPDSLTNNIIKLDSASSMASDYNKAIDTLTKIENNYSKNSKNGIIKGLETKIKEASSKKLQISYNEEEDLRLKNLRVTLEEEIKELQKEKERVSSYEVIKNKGEQKAKAIENLNKYLEANEEIKKGFNNQIITATDISDLRSYHMSFELYKKEIEAAKISKEDEDKFLDLDYLFKTYPLNEEGLNNIKEKEQHLIELDTKENNLSNDLSIEEKEVLDLFSDKELTENELKMIEDNLTHYQESLNYVTNASSYQAEAKKDNRLSIFLVIISTLLTGGAIALYFFNLTGAIILSALALLSIIFTFIYLIKNKDNSSKGDIIKETTKMKEYEDKLRTITVKYTIYSPNIINDVNTLKNKWATYLSLKEKINNISKDKEEIIKERNAIKEELNNIKNHYHLDDDIYNSLLLKYHEYLSLTKRINEVGDKISTLNTNIKDIKNAFLAIKNKYKLSLEFEDDNYIEVIDQYKDKLSQYNENEKQIKYWKEEIENYQDEDVDIDTSTFRNKEEIDNDIKEKEATLSSTLNAIRNLEEAKEEINRLDREIEESNATLTEAKKEQRVYQDTIEALNETNNLIISKYIEPIKNEFVKYASLIEKLIGQSVHLTSNFELQFKQGDSLRSYNHLSLGEKTIAGMVLRLSFISQLFKDEETFLLLDDPFTDLDEKHLAKAIKFLKDKAKEMQIIYITCHPSRVIK